MGPALTRAFVRTAMWCLAALTVGLAASPAAAQSEYPTKPIRLVLGFATGGPTDILARVLADQLSRSFGTTVVVENRVGAGGNIAASSVARSAPDGYTILVGGTNYAIGRSWHKNLQFDILKDFRMVGTLSSNPNILVVNPASGLKTLSDVLREARAKPGQMSFASSGAGTVVHLAAELFKAREKLDLRHIPYNGAAPAELDLMAGRVSMMFDSFAVALPFVREGKMQAIGVTSRDRSAYAPDIPSLAEQGLTDFDVTSWYAVWAPRGVPDAIVQRLNRAINDALAAPDVKARLESIQAVAMPLTPDAADAFMNRQTDQWTRAVELLGPRPD